MKHFDAIIIGAGSVGLPLSYYLSLKGNDVAVIDKNHSYGRGENRAAIGGIRATHSDPAKIKICQLSIDIIKDIEESHGISVNWIEGGYLYPIFEAEKEKSLKELLVKQKSYGLNIDWISPEEIIKLVPGINPNGLLGGTYSPHDGYASPLKTAGAYYKLSLKAGTTFYFDEEVVSMQRDGDKITSVKTDKREITADIYINAAGGYAREIGQMCGLDLPVYPDSHEAGVTEPVKHFFKPMVVDLRSDNQSANFYYYQNEDGQILFCVTPEPSILGKDADSTSEFLPLISRRMIALHPRLKNIRVRRTWRGMYPMTPDGFPIVGRPKDISNMFLAVGMCGQGFMLGPGLGKIISEIIVNKTDKYNLILDQLSLYRKFEGNEMLK
ncbi:MAG: FAD-binding oxidoreductase [Candidatus Delongbacteria bacterium]|nr:FAD-binding oxidoreductase [Candidatus Delongbacteria bacterium]MCG2761218.1 FAD-binding oxidoreductase [Candidatus Delongbacteria bacterium]